MKIQHFRFGTLVVFVVALMIISTNTYADVTVQLEDSLFQAQLTARLELYGQPKATSYYDDLVDHYEQDQLRRDVIDEGI
jgi:hypothetical protein